MNQQTLIPVEEFCASYAIEIHVFSSLKSFGLVQSIYKENREYLEEEQLKDLEKMIHLHQDLEINLEGVEVIIELLRKIEQLQKSLKMAKAQLKWLERDL